MKMTILDTILEQIDETTLQKRFDKPLDQCLLSFSHPIPDELSGNSIHQYLIEFYKHIRHNGILPSIEISNEKASEEIIWILESNYQGDKTVGYKGFLFDFIYGDRESRQILIVRFIEILKNMECEKYISFIFKSKIDPLDWYKKYELVLEIFQRHNKTISPHILAINPKELVPALEEIIKRIYPFRFL